MGRKRHVAPAASSARTRQERRIDELVAAREALMGEIAMRARIDALPPMLAKARTLLTRYWARGTWQSRAEILGVARMLLVLGAAQSGLQPPAGRAAPPKRRRAKLAGKTTGTPGEKTAGKPGRAAQSSDAPAPDRARERGE